MYEQGKGVPKDFQEAMKWYQMAAEHGSEKTGGRRAKKGLSKDETGEDQGGE
jgi:TPR repeat protein